MPTGKELRVVRATQVRRLNAVARKHAVPRVDEGAAKPVVEALIATVQSQTGLTGAEMMELEDTAAKYLSLIHI